MSQPPGNRPPTRRVSTGRPQPPPEPPQQSYRSQRSQPPPRQSRNVNAPRRSDPFPIVLGAIIGALVIGLMVVVYLISSNNGGTGGTGGTNSAGGAQPTTAAGGAAPTTAAQNDNATLTTSDTAGPTEEPAPRMPLADFKKLYDDPKQRPLIIDVRAKEAFDAGHIEGAISLPEADVDTRVGELPKDKLVVAYCQ